MTDANLLDRERAGLYRAFCREIAEQERQERMSVDGANSRAERDAAREQASVARSRSKSWAEQLAEHDRQHGRVEPDTLALIATIALSLGVPIDVRLIVREGSDTLDVLVSRGADSPVYWVGGCPAPDGVQPISPRRRAESIAETLAVMGKWIVGEAA